MKSIFLKPGEWFVGDHSHRVHTLLGSCVTITLWHPHTKQGGMSHFLLPARGSSSHDTRDGRYAEDVLPMMLDALAALGTPRLGLEAKIFGGGDMFPGLSQRGLSVGQRNGEAGKRLLEEAGIPLRSESLFGIGHRKIVFDIRSGHVWSHQLPPVTIGKP